MDALVEERWREERRSRLLEAAARVFAKHSFEQSSMDEIAHEAGVGKPTLYRYFAGKDDLFLAVFVQALDDLEERLDRVLAGTQGAAPRLRGLLAEMVPTFRHHLVSLRLGGGPAATADQSKRRLFRERRARLGAYIVDALADGVSRGELRDMAGEMVAQFMIGMIRSATTNTDASDERIVDGALDVVLNGLVPRTGGAGRDGAEPSGARRKTGEPKAQP